MMLVSARWWLGEWVIVSVLPSGTGELCARCGWVRAPRCHPADGDGDMDIPFLTTSVVGVLDNWGGGVFTSRVVHTACIRAMVSVDLDGDRDVDLLAVHSLTCVAPGSGPNNIVWYENGGPGVAGQFTFRTAVAARASWGSFGELHPVDFDGDGDTGSYG